MARTDIVKRSYTATETIVRWVLGTRPGGKYFLLGEPDHLTSNLMAAKSFMTDTAAKEALTLSVPPDIRYKLKVIRVSQTTRESCNS